MSGISYLSTTTEIALQLRHGGTGAGQSEARFAPKARGACLIRVAIGRIVAIWTAMQRAGRRPHAGLNVGDRRNPIELAADGSHVRILVAEGSGVSAK
jgi:hypothetical protein